MPYNFFCSFFSKLQYSTNYWSEVLKICACGWKSMLSVLNDRQIIFLHLHLLHCNCWQSASSCAWHCTIRHYCIGTTAIDTTLIGTTTIDTTPIGQPALSLSNQANHFTACWCITLCTQNKTNVFFFFDSSIVIISPKCSLLHLEQICCLHYLDNVFLHVSFKKIYLHWNHYF